MASSVVLRLLATIGRDMMAGACTGEGNTLLSAASLSLTCYALGMDRREPAWLFLVFCYSGIECSVLERTVGLGARSSNI